MTNKFIHMSYFGGLESKYTHISNDCEWKDEYIAEQLNDLLPHGSGINYDWHFEFLKNGKVVCHNSYDAMNDVGMYCHIYDFSVKLIPTMHHNSNGKNNHSFEFDSFSFKGQKENSCCGYGLKDYLQDTIEL